MLQTVKMSQNSSEDILDKINQIVHKHQLISDSYDVTKKVVDFEHPNDLFKLLPLDIEKTGLDDQELEGIRYANNDFKA